MNYDNTALFSGSEDGSFAFIQIIDKDPRRKENFATIQPTNEVLVPKIERIQILDDIKSLKYELEQQ